MTPEAVMDLAHSTLTVTAMIAAPLLLTALVATPPTRPPELHSLVTRRLTRSASPAGPPPAGQ